jgi:UDP-glucose 4-epimerase
MKKVLITGSHGFLGRNISKTLSGKSLLIEGIGHGNWKKKDYKKWGFSHLVNADVNLKNLTKNFKKFDYIIHCAGSGKVGLSYKDDYNKNINSTKSILEFIKRSSPKSKLIYLSSYSVYGDTYKFQIKENFKTKPISIYAKNKKKAEDLCLKYANQYNFDLMIMRVASLYGEGLEKQFIHDACKKITNGGNNFYGTGDEKRDFIHISDMCKIVSYFIKNGFKSDNIINCGTGKGKKIKMVLNMILKNFNLKVKPIFDKKGLNDNPKNLIANINKLKNLGFSPKKNFNVGIKQYINWYKEKNL